MNNRILLTLSFIALAFTAFAGGNDTLTNKQGSEYRMVKVANHEALDVQNQAASGTCWSFSTLSFFESELMRMGKGQHKLSEMFIVRHAYVDKAEQYVRFNGHFNFGAGGAFHDIPHVVRKHGIVPEEAYKGLEYGTEKHRHMEMDEVLKAMVDAVVKNPNKSLTPAWKKAVAAVVDAYLGEIPESFTYRGKTYTPKSFAKELGLDMDDYVEIGSFTHHPYYSQFVLEVPDNWALGRIYNIPLDELMEVMEHALKNGHTIAWGADVSEKGFSFRDGLAIVPEDETSIKTKGTDSRYFSDAGAEKISNAFYSPVPEKAITPEMRQAAFDNYETTDDHGMHITGLYTGTDGTKYYFVKNSWGTANECDGYFFASEAYIRYKTIDIMVHKDAIPKHIRKKMGL